MSDTLFAFSSDLLDSQHSLSSYHNLGIGLYECRPFSRLPKCPFPLLPVKKTPPLSPPAQCCQGWFKECFLLRGQVRIIKSNIEYKGKGEEKQNTVKSQFFQKFM